MHPEHDRAGHASPKPVSWKMNTTRGDGERVACSGISRGRGRAAGTPPRRSGAIMWPLAG